MKKFKPFQKLFWVDPLALAVACVISLLFANATQQYLNTSKRNLSCDKNQATVSYLILENTSPEDRPDAWGFEKIIAFPKQEKNKSLLPVTFDIHRDYKTRLKGCFSELSQPPAWLPSIPIAHRKLII